MLHNLFLLKLYKILFYILVLINSKLIHYYWTLRNSDSKKTFPKIKKKPLDSIPIASRYQDNMVKRIEYLVSRILVIKQENPLSDTTIDEQEIDLLVYKLYDLTYDEVLIVDPQTPITREEYEAVDD